MISRRDALKMGAGAAAVAATGGAAFVWLNSDRDEPQQAGSNLPTRESRGDASSSTTNSSELPSGIADVVREDGFDVNLGQVHVFAPAGVAAAGTAVSVSQLPREPPAEYLGFSAIVGQPIEIKLGDGMQPGQPITVVFDLTGWEDVTDGISADAPIAVVGRSDEEEDFLLYNAILDEQGRTLTAVVNHLTEFWPIRIDLKKIVTDFLYGLLNLQHPRPACAYQPHTSGGATFNVRSITGEAFWPCVHEEDGDLVLELHSNSVLPWTVYTSPITSGTVSGDFFDASPTIGYVYQEIHRLFGVQRSIVMTGKTTQFRFDGSSRVPAIDVEVDRMFFVAGIAVSVVAAMLERLQLKNLAKFLLDSIGALLCLVETINTTYEETSQELARSGFMTALTCVTEWLEDAVKTSGKFFLATITSVISLLVSGASGLAGVVVLFLSDATGTSRFSVRIDRDEPTVSQPDPSTTNAADRPERAGGAVPMFRGNAARTGEMPGPLPMMDRPIEAVWTISPDGLGISDPVVAEGMLFATGGGVARLYAVDVSTAQEAWAADIAGELRGLVLAESILLVSGADATLSAFDAATGQERWRTRAASDVDTSAAAYLDQTLFIPGIYENLYAIDPTTGAERWRHQFTSDEPIAVPVAANGMVFINNATELLALSAESGNTIWTVSSSERISARAFKNDTLFAFSHDNVVHALDASSGDERWRTNVDLRLSAIAVNDDVVYVGSNDSATMSDGTVHALSSATGEELWRFTHESSVDSPVIVDNSIIVFCGTGGFEDGELVALDSETGEEQWSLATPPRVHSPIVVDGLIILRGRYMTALGNI